jgi:hypothetical protein
MLDQSLPVLAVGPYPPFVVILNRKKSVTLLHLIADVHLHINEMFILGLAVFGIQIQTFC